MSETRKGDRIEQMKCDVLEEANWRCQYPHCYNSATELAHGIGQGDHHISETKTLWNSEYNERRTWKWIENNVIHNRLNLWASCSVHNSSFDFSNNPEKVKKKLAEIREDLIKKEILKEKE